MLPFQQGFQTVLSASSFGVILEKESINAPTPDISEMLEKTALDATDTVNFNNFFII